MFHKARSLCCAQVADASTCTHALHDASSSSLTDTVRAALSAGYACVTYRFLMTYADITHSLQQLTSVGVDAALPSQLIASAALHTMKHHDTAFYHMEVVAFLRETAKAAWRGTEVVLHGCASPNYTAINAGGYPQRPEVVSNFNAALREAVDADAVVRRGVRSMWWPLPQLIEYASVTGEGVARQRFPYLDSVHFAEPFYQTAFVVDALVLRAASCMRVQHSTAIRPAGER